MRFAIIGAGGFSFEVADILADLGHEIVAFLDDSPSTPLHSTTGKPVLRSLTGVEFDSAVVAIGRSETRRRLFDMLGPDVNLPPVVHPSAVVSPHANLGAGTLVMHNAVVSSRAIVGAGAIVNVGAYVAHDCEVGPFTHLASGVRLGGGSRVGADCLCGTNTVILPGISVGDGVTCGAGAVVISDVEDGLTVVGVPARAVTDRSESW